MCVTPMVFATCVIFNILNFVALGEYSGFITWLLIFISVVIPIFQIVACCASVKSNVKYWIALPIICIVESIASFILSALKLANYTPEILAESYCRNASYSSYSKTKTYAECFATLIEEEAPLLSAAVDSISKTASRQFLLPAVLYLIAGFHGIVVFLFIVKSESPYKESPLEE